VTGDYGARLRAVSDGAGPAELFAQYAGLQMLCAVRRGPFGVAAMNAAVERALAAAGLIDPGDPWYPGRPVIVTANDYGLGLFNGDMCLILPHPVGGRPSACFKSNDGEYRWLHPARLPEHATAWALTVHKSQGSEFDEVLVVLPDEDAPLLTAELLYTALTRAKQRAELWASSASLRRCVARRVTRESGLPRRIAAN
ncbi:MAG: exodeoxyribonuclease V subunit alpha, partial [Proteobacteria bacterium]